MHTGQLANAARGEAQNDVGREVVLQMRFINGRFARALQKKLSDGRSLLFSTQMLQVAGSNKVFAQ